MIEEIERVLADGGDLELIRERLRNQAIIERDCRNAQIEHDYRIAVLIRETLQTEPRGTAGYSIAKAIIKRLRLKYEDPDTRSVKRELWQMVKETEGNENDGSTEGTGSEITQ